MTSPRLLPIFALLASCAPAAPPKSPANAADLVAMEAAFMQAVADKRLEGWMAFFADDAVSLPNNSAPVRGKAAIRADMAPLFADPTFRITWKPSHADVSAAGDLGYTWGFYEVKGTNDGKPFEGKGKYFTVWKKQADGSWKVVLDGGNSLPKPAH